VRPVGCSVPEDLDNRSRAFLSGSIVVLPGAGALVSAARTPTGSAAVGRRGDAVPRAVRGGPRAARRSTGAAHRLQKPRAVGNVGGEHSRWDWAFPGSLSFAMRTERDHGRRDGPSGGV